MSNFRQQPAKPGPSSYKQLLHLLELAAHREESARLLTIAGPLEFRRQILSFVSNQETNPGPAIQLLLNPKIPSIRILLADPDGAAFLGSLDSERAGSWDICCARHEVLTLAKGLATVADQRSEGGELQVGLHRSELIWEVGIIGNDSVLLRAYGTATRHDASAKSAWVKTGEPEQFTESFSSLWNAVSKRTDTRWLRHESIQTDAEPHWPSLYKGNAILAKEQDFDKEDKNGRILTPVLKVCRNRRDQESERRWLRITEKQRASLAFLNPVRLAAEKVPVHFSKHPLVIERVKGYSLFEIAYRLVEAGVDEAKNETASLLLGEILENSLQALREYRQLATEVLPKKRMRKYRYDTKLVAAMAEVRSFVGAVRPQDYDSAVSEARALGEELVMQATVPFRDSNLKNRFLRSEAEMPELIRDLIVVTPSRFSSQLRSDVTDIDFEAAGYLVTPWDDVIHVLFFEKSGATPVWPDIDGENSYEYWWGPIEERLGLWQTVLARSVGAVCRRLWFARVMPYTFSHRYRFESRDFFLRLGMVAARQLVRYRYIEQFLKSIQDSPEVWANVGGTPTLCELVARRGRTRKQ